MRLAIIAVALAAALPALAQEHGHPPQDAQLHDQFYSTWLRPAMRKKDGERQWSCCSEQDCYPTKFKFDPRDGTWFFWGREAQAWRPVPTELMEHTQPDPRESPDGQGHVCASPGHVFCAVPGSGI